MVILFGERISLVYSAHTKEPQMHERLSSTHRLDMNINSGDDGRVAILSHPRLIEIVSNLGRRTVLCPCPLIFSCKQRLAQLRNFFTSVSAKTELLLGLLVHLCLDRYTKRQCVQSIHDECPR